MPDNISARMRARAARTSGAPTPCAAAPGTADTLGAPVPRLAVESDLPAIVAIYNSTIPARGSTADLEPVTVESRRPWFAQHSAERRPLWVVEQDGEVLAWVSLDDYKQRAAYGVTAEVSVYVRDDVRGRGIARALCQYAIAAAPRLGLTRLLAVVFAHNEPSVGLFRSLGFERWGLLPGVTVLDGVERDVLLLGLRVSPAGERA